MRFTHSTDQKIHMYVLTIVFSVEVNNDKSCIKRNNCHNKDYGKTHGKARMFNGPRNS